MNAEIIKFKMKNVKYIVTIKIFEGLSIYLFKR